MDAASDQPDAASDQPDAASDQPDGSIDEPVDGTCAERDPCKEGAAITASCNACTAAVCAYDDYCCLEQWDEICVEEAREKETCGCLRPECVAVDHGVCAEGKAIPASCSAFASAVCKY